MSGTGLVESNITDGRQTADAQQFVSELLRVYPEHADFSAKAILIQHPWLQHSRSCVIDLAFEEYCRKREAGSGLTATEFVAEYRDIESSLYRVIEFEQLLSENPSLFSGENTVHWPVVGDRIFDLQLTEQIGRGLLSRVFLAHQKSLGSRPVIAKVCLRGEQEAQLMGRLRHPAICFPLSVSQLPCGDVSDSTLRTGNYSPLSVICMPFLTRATLHHVTEIAHQGSASSQLTTAGIQAVVNQINDPRGELTLPRYRADNTADPDFCRMFGSWFRLLAEAVEAAHSENILHCDIKPGNVLVLPDLSVQLLDFNLAFSSNSDRGRIAGGTMPYMSPEQLSGLFGDEVNKETEIPIGGETDVWGLCATLWHFLTGQPPFGLVFDPRNRRTAAAQLQARHKNGVSEASILAARKVCPGEICDVLIRGLSLDENRRIQTATQLLCELTSAEQAFRKRSTSTLRQLARSVSARIKPTRLLAILPFVFLPVLLVLSLTQRPEGFVQEVASAADALLAGGHLAQAEELLAHGLSSVPDAEELALTLADCRLRLGRPAQAHQTILPFVAAAASEEIRFLDLYCRCLQLEVPLSDIQQSGDESTNNVEEGLRAKWISHLNEWRKFTESSSLGTAARTNIAVMHFEIQQFVDCARILDQLSDEHSYPSFDRMQKCLVVQKQLSLRSAESPPDIRQLLSRSCSEMSRSELVIFINAAVRVGAPDSHDADASSFSWNRIKDIIDEVVPRRVDAQSLRMLVRESRVMHDPEFVRRLSSMIDYPGDRPGNSLHLILVGPADIAGHAANVF